MSFLAGFETAAASDISPLRAATAVRTPLPPAGWLLAGLFMTCLLPRAWMTWKLDVICEDGPVYVTAARHLEVGQLQTAFRTGNLGLNLYPVVLALLHQSGLDWVLAGRLWGMLMASLVVFPLFGLIRRQFEDRIAALACLLYAAHPTMIERTPDMLRCPTFWFLLTLAVYLLWRAVLEVRLGLFAAAGVAMSLAVHTRVEGWFLLVPWLLWSGWRFHALESGRLKLASGAALGLLMIPLLILVVNLTWLRHHSQWEICFVDRLPMLRQWFLAPTPSATPGSAASVPSAPAPSVPISTPAPTTAAPSNLAPGTPAVLPPAVAASPASAEPTGPDSVSGPSLAWLYVRKLVDAFDPVFGLFTLIGLWSFRRAFLRCDQQVLFLMNLVFLAAIAVFLIKVHEVIGRYFFPVAILSASYAAAGFVATARALAGLRLLAAAKPKFTAVAASLLVLVTILGWTDALTTSHASRRQRMALGRWIRDTVGPHQLVIGSEDRAFMMAYYAEGWYEGPKLHDRSPEAFRQLVYSRAPAMVLVWGGKAPAAESAYAVQVQSGAHELYAYEPLPADVLPPGCGNLVALVRCRPEARVARRGVQP
jgi:hypothetical protein